MMISVLCSWDFGIRGSIWGFNGCGWLMKCEFGLQFSM
jgi:hypothetical protein